MRRLEDMGIFKSVGKYDLNLIKKWFLLRFWY